MIVSPSSAGKPGLRWFQFSLRSLLIFVTLSALACSWFTVTMQHARKQRADVEQIRKLGGNVYYSYQCDGSGTPVQPALILQPGGKWEKIERPEPLIPQFLRDWLGDDFFYRVSAIEPSSLKDIDAMKGIDTCQRASSIRFTAWITESRTDDEIRDQLQELFPRCKIVTNRVTHVSWADSGVGP
jgi:hypothetical protein